MEVTFIQGVLQVRLHCGLCVKVFITENISSKCYLSYKHLFNCAIFGTFSMEN